MLTAPVMNNNVLFKSSFNPDVRLLDLYGKNCIYFQYNGIFRLKDAEVALDRTTSYLKENNEHKKLVVWNCLGIKDYETAARTMCQDAVKEYQDTIDTIYVIANSPIIFAAVEIISFFTSLPITVVSSFEKLEEKFNFESK